MRLIAKLKAIKRKIRTAGLLRTLMIVIIHIRNLIIHRKILIYFADISANMSYQYTQEETLSAKEIISVEDLTQEDTRAIVNYIGEQYVKTIQKRLEKDWLLYLGYVEGELGGAAWVVPDFSEFKTRHMKYVDKSVSIVDCWTIPEHRGKGVYPFLLAHIVHRLRTKFLDKVFIEVNEINHASIKGIEKAGFQRFTL